MNVYEQKLVDALRAQIDELQRMLDAGRSHTKPRKMPPVNPALLWRERVVGFVKMSVAAEFGGTPEELTGKSNKRYVAMRRHIAMHLCRRAGMSLIDTARAFSCGNHSTVSYAIYKVQRMRAVRSVDEAVKRLEAVVDQRFEEAAA